jgi:rod shape-determining protein MreC
MRKLIAFFRRFRVFVVFIVLQLIALGSYFSVLSYPRSRFFNTSSAITGTFFTWENDILKYISLDEQNKSLQKENVALSKKNPAYFISVDPKTAIIEDTIKKLAFERIPAQVINSSYSYKNNYFTIDAGSEKGIKRKMGVVSPSGVIGIVYDISKHYSVVKSIPTSSINISAYIGKSNAHGLIKYQEIDPRRVSLTGISNDIRIKRGAQVLARGSGGYFPKGTLIGKVEKTEEIEGKPVWNITVRLDQDMRKLSAVYVIKNIFHQELNDIEKEYEQLK